MVILYHAPHPDVSAISQSIAQNETYEVETYPIDKFNKAIDDYNVVVLHQLPSKTIQPNHCWTIFKNYICLFSMFWERIRIFHG